MAGHASASEIAKKYENKFNPNTYIRAAESLISPGHKGKDDYSKPLDELIQGVNQSKINGKATPDVYAKFAESAQKIREKIPQSGNKGIIGQYEDFIRLCKTNASYFYDRQKPAKKSSSQRP